MHCTLYTMASSNCMLLIWVALFVVCVCGATRIYPITEAREEHDIVTRMEALEKTQRESGAEIRALRETVADQKDTIDKQSMKLRTLEQDIITLKASQHRQVKRFQRNQKLPQSLLQASRRKVEKHNSNTTPLSISPAPRRHGNEREITTYREEKPTVQDESVSFRFPKRQATGGVAFTAFLDDDVTAKEAAVLKFNQVITNDGNGYNTNTGIFTTFIDGMYLFYFAVGVRDANQLYVALKVNGQNTVEATGEGYHPMQDLQGGNMAIVRLRQGDSVWVEAMYREHVEGAADLRLTTFTGVLLYP